jgi:hypothetical protein
MFSPFEAHGQSILPQKSGSLELNTDCYRIKRPLWLISLKLLGSLVMIAVGAAIAVPSLLEFGYPLWQAIAVTGGGMVIYTAIAFFIRPEANTDEIAGGVNKFLWRLHCVLGPGRFTADTLLDTCTYVGILGGEQAAAGLSFAEGPFAAGRSAGLSSFDATQPIAPLDPNRFAQSSGNFVAGQIQLDSQRFFSSVNPSPAGVVTKA